MKFLKKLFLFFSAFVPLFILLYIKIMVDIINKNLTFNFLNTFNLYLLSTMIILGIFGLLWNTTLCKDKSYEITIKNTEEITDKYFLQYFSLFVMFAIPLDISYVNEFCVYILILIFIGVVYINSDLFYINPLLNMLGFRFFNTTFIDKNTGEKKSAKIFCRKSLLQNQNYKIKIKNKNFSFVIDENKNKN